MGMRISLGLVLLAVGACAADPTREAPGASWPRTGTSIDASTRGEITDLYARYALFADSAQGKAYASLFSKRGEIVMSSLRITGHEALARRVGDKQHQTMHLQGEPVLVQLAPDRMVARTPVILGVRARAIPSSDTPGDPPTFRFSFYEDELVRTAKGWRFERRTALPAPTPSEEFLRGHSLSAED